MTTHEAIVQLRKQKCGDLRKDHSPGSFAERGKMRKSNHGSVVKSEVLETSTFEFLGCLQMALLPHQVEMWIKEKVLG